MHDDDAFSYGKGPIINAKVVILGSTGTLLSILSIFLSFFHTFLFISYPPLHHTFCLLSSPLFLSPSNMSSFFYLLTSSCSGVGKTALSVRYCEGVFLTTTKATIGGSFLAKNMYVPPLLPLVLPLYLSPLTLPLLVYS